MSTNKAFAKYQEIYDVNTVSNKVSVIGIHTPVGAKPRKMLGGFFTQFRKYKYVGCSVVGTPAQRLGLNLAQLSTAAGQSQVNPKDVFNPALVRGCHGDNLNAALNSIYKGSFQNEGSTLGMDQFTDSVVPAGTLTWEAMYYRMLQDPSFKKFSLNSGIKLKGLHPMVYNVASQHQLLPNESAGIGANVGKLVDDGQTTHYKPFSGATDGYVSSGDGNANTHIFPQFFTNRLQALGWMDTRQVINASTSSEPAYTVLPKIFMACIVLPPALSDSVVTSMRFVVTHYFAFKEFNTSLTLEGASEYYDWLSAVSKASKENDTFETLSTQDSVELVNDACF